MNDLKNGEYFGEVALLVNGRRTATILVKDYATIGHIDSQSFEEMLTNFPEIRKKFMDSLQFYSDPFKIWQKS